MTLSEIIKKYRYENNCSMDRLASDSGLTKGYISMLENGKNPSTNKPIVPKIESLSKLAAGMGMNLDQLISIMDDTPVDISGTENKESYYIDDEAKELAQFLFQNPEYRVLFDASRHVRKKDIDFVKQFIEKMSK